MTAVPTILALAVFFAIFVDDGRAGLSRVWRAHNSSSPHGDG